MARGEVTGWLTGAVLSPLTGLTSALRHSRMFHPSGITCVGEAVCIASSPAAREVGERLAGPVLMRWSSAWWKRGEHPDVLGCALRFTRGPIGVEPQAGDQDLLLATIQRPWTMAFAPLTTRQHDFLSNTYYGVSPFDVPPLGRIEWRLSTPGASYGGLDRAARLARSIDAGAARARLEWCAYPGALVRPRAAAFEPLIELRIARLVDVDQRRLRFDPFRAGRGVTPVGFVHAMRRAAYWTSQALRPG
jgi:hypothetical protein